MSPVEHLFDWTFQPPPMALPLGGRISHETTFVVVADRRGKLRVVLDRVNGADQIKPDLLELKIRKHRK